MIDRLGPPHHDSALGQQPRQPIELALRFIDERRLDRAAAKGAIRAACREIGGEPRLEADLGRASRGADDHLLERIPLVPAANEASQARPG